MEFTAGTEWFRHVHKDVKRYFVKGTPFLGGKSFPLQEGVMAKDMDKILKWEDISGVFYATKL